MCCSGSRASRLAISSQNLGSNEASGTLVSAPRATPCTCAAISSASVRGDSTPAPASRAVATAISSSSRLIVPVRAALLPPRPGPPARPAHQGPDDVDGTPLSLLPQQSPIDAVGAG